MKAEIEIQKAMFYLLQQDNKINVVKGQFLRKRGLSFFGMSISN